jgi:CRISPR/Cas system-associated exonuclease Cas4 (RecB family)
MHAIGIHKGILLYVQKDNLQSNYFELQYNKEEAEKIIERFGKLHYLLKSQILPEAEAKLDSEAAWLCKYCSWREECEKAGLKEKSFSIG